MADLVALHRAAFLNLCNRFNEKENRQSYIAGLFRLSPPYLCSRTINTMDSIQLLGLAAGSLTTAAFFPQVVKTWKSRSAKDLSLGMFSLFCVGVLLWLIYGIVVRDVPVIAANLLTLMLASTLLFFKLRFKQ
jgi:MtN3 and saliva related transmembrane protein